MQFADAFAPSVGPKSSPERLSSALAVLAAASLRFSDEPEKLHDAADRIAFRITKMQDLFHFCPTKTGVPLGGGTIWGLICASPPLVAGVLIRRLFVESMGDEFPLTEIQADAVLWAVGEQPRNAGILELVSRSPTAREMYGSRGLLGHALGALHVCRELIASAPSARIETDRGCMGTTTAVYGLRDGDAHLFTEVDLARCVIETLISPECKAWPEAALNQGSESIEALREAYLIAVDIGATLSAHPIVIARVYAFVSSAMPKAFAAIGNTPDICSGDNIGDLEDIRLNMISAGKSFWTFVHMLVSSSAGNFAENVLEVTRINRMRSPTEVEQAREKLFTRRRPDGDGGRLGRGKGPAPDAARLALCHVVLLLLRIVKLSKHLGGQPEKFRLRALETLKERYLPPLRKALDGICADAWPEIRVALGALVLAYESLPTSPAEQEWIDGVEAAFIRFAANRFLRIGSLLTEEAAEDWLDPFNTSRAALLAETVEVHPEVPSRLLGSFRECLISAGYDPGVIALLEEPDDAENEELRAEDLKRSDVEHEPLTGAIEPRMTEAAAEASDTVVSPRGGATLGLTSRADVEGATSRPTSRAEVEGATSRPTSRAEVVELLEQVQSRPTSRAEVQAAEEVPFMQKEIPHPRSPLSLSNPQQQAKAAEHFAQQQADAEAAAAGAAAVAAAISASNMTPTVPTGAKGFFYNSSTSGFVS
eukprot:TRINITY_DN8385_c0_g1_i1.p1 TRINITY_DN8385_c0_g1~~TRINITY_DN8385_c0_g1_i1.p1  ORF type:complete len:710 (+),score=137.13 TRINITY_DN8385_c0_g1_i1:101-2230(+)